jgi:hypothetical protein
MRKNFDARLHRLEEQMQPMVVASVLRQARTGPPEDLGERLLDAICAMKTRQHQDAIFDALTPTQLEAVVGKPDFGRFLDSIPIVQLQALAAGDPAAQRQCEMDYRRWRKAQSL